MNVKNLFKVINEDSGSNHKAAIKQLGQLYRMWEEDDTYILVKETVNREIALCLDQSDISEGLEKSALMFGYIKGLKSVLNRLEWYKHSADEVIKQEKEEKEQSDEMIAEDNKFIAGLEAGPDSGQSSIVR